MIIVDNSFVIEIEMIILEYIVNISYVSNKYLVVSSSNFWRFDRVNISS
jgi:hypothetical protein